VPVGDRALGLLREYLAVRAGSRIKGPRPPLFLTNRQAAMTRQRFWQIVAEYALRVGIHEAVVAAHAEAFVCDASGRQRCRPASSSSDARPRRPWDDRSLHTRVHDPLEGSLSSTPSVRTGFMGDR